MMKYIRYGTCAKVTLLGLFLILSAAGCVTMDSGGRAVTGAGDGSGQSKSDEELVARYRAGAEQGEAEAQVAMGKMYANGQGVAQDYGEAVKWYRKAADQRNAEGQVSLGSMYAKGFGVEQNDKEAARWFRKAAVQGNARGQNSLGFMYANGRGVQKNDKEAVKWYRKAAEQGHAMSQNSLGFMYANGRGVQKNDKEAVKWYRKAAEQGHAMGQNNLGVRYVTGRGVQKNDKEAAKWYRKAADQGNAFAQSNLGFLYLNGNGVKQSDKEALKWLRLAARQDNDRAKKAIEERFNYDAMDDDAPIPYEEHLKAHSLELYRDPSGVIASGDGKRIIVQFKEKGSKDNFVGASVWEYDARKRSFVKHSFRFLHKMSRLAFGATLSSDGMLLAYYREDPKKEIVLADLDRLRTLQTIPLPADARFTGELAISHDNERLAVSLNDRKSIQKEVTTFREYSVKDGQFLRRTVISEASSIYKMFFCPDDSLVVEYSGDDRRNVKIYNSQGQSERVASVRRSGGDYRHVYGYHISGVFPDGNRLMLSHLDPDDRDHHSGIYDVRSRKWEVSDLPLVSKVVFGPLNRFADFKGESILQDERVSMLQRLPVDSSDVINYVAEAGHWVILTEDRQYIMEPASDAIVEAVKVLGDGRTMIEIGFYERGVDRIRNAINMYPATDCLNDTALYADLAENNVPMRHIGGLLLTLYEKLLEENTLDQKQAITRAVERLRDYGLFASAAGHPELALQAAERIRFLQGRYPDAAPWDQLLKNAVVLEALKIALVESPDKAYDFIVSQGGLIQDNYIAVSESIVSRRYKSYWSPLYSDMKKLAYVLNRDDTRLESPEALLIEHQPYPDLSGRQIRPVTAPSRLEEPSRQNGKPAATPSRPKGRVLD